MLNAVPTRKALHIGLSDYKGDPAVGSDTSARTLRAIADQAGFETRELIGPAEVTYKLVTDAIAAYAHLPAASAVLITFSGHGVESPVKPHAGCPIAEPTWCLNGSLLFYNQIHSLLAGFKPRVRILVISDSCQSGAPVGVPVRKIIQIHQRLNAMTACVERVSADVILFSACSENQDAVGSEDEKTPSIFVDTVKRMWDGGAYRGSLQSFAAAVGADVDEQARALVPPRRQTPQLNCVDGRCDPAFLQCGPFRF
jgi:hypothetical protein